MSAQDDAPSPLMLGLLTSAPRRTASAPAAPQSTDVSAMEREEKIIQGDIAESAGDHDRARDLRAEAKTGKRIARGFAGRGYNRGMVLFLAQISS